MPSNPDRANPAWEFMFSRKPKNIIHPNLYFTNLSIVKTASQKHLGLSFNARLMLNDHLIVEIGDERCWISS